VQPAKAREQEALRLARAASQAAVVVAFHVACPSRFSVEERQSALRGPVALMEEALHLLRARGGPGFSEHVLCSVVLEALDHEGPGPEQTLPALETLLGTARKVNHGQQASGSELCRLATFLLRLTRVADRAR